MQLSNALNYLLLSNKQYLINRDFCYFLINQILKNFPKTVFNNSKCY